MRLPERVLNGVQLASTGRQPLHRGELAPVGLHREHQARTHGRPIHQDRAGSTDPMLAPDVRAGQFQGMPQEVAEEESWLHIGAMLHTVDGQSDLHGEGA